MVLAKLSREAWEHGAGQEAGNSRGACRRVAGHRLLLPSDICPLIFACSGLGAGVAFERLGPLGCTGCPASTCGLSTWWSTTALNETWF